MQRIRALVDLAYNNDKRIAKYKDEEKQRKLAAKRAKMDAAQALRDEQERAAREVQLERERAEKAEQKRIEQIRIEREQIKRALKKERKMLRDRAKEYKYFASNDKESLRNMEGIERLCENLTVSELQELNRMLATNAAHDVYYKAIKELDIKLKEQHGSNIIIPNGYAKHVINNVTVKATAAAATTTTTTSTTNSTTNNNINGISISSSSNDDNHIKNGIIKEVKKKEELWIQENMQLLIKAVNLFPAGTAQRWDVVAAFINQHTTNGVQVTARYVLNRAKAMQQSDFSKSVLKQIFSITIDIKNDGCFNKTFNRKYTAKEQGLYQ